MDPATRSFLASGAAAGGHIGIIAQGDDYLAGAVSEWARSSLVAGGGAILVGTPAHLERIRAQLRRDGVDIDRAERTGHAVLIDADWLLANFMIDGTPDASRFRALLDEILASVVALVGSAGRVRAWGEMVSLLRLRNSADAAIRLEALWERALEERGFSLLCSYQTRDPSEHPSGDLIRDVAHTHGSWLQEQIGVPSGPR